MKSNLKEIRTRKDWGMGEFAVHMGISISHLSLIENNKRTPSLELAISIAEALDVSVEELWENSFALRK